MKGTEAEYVVPLGRMFKMPRTKRVNRAITEIRTFAYKHTKNKAVKIAPELNRKVWANSKNIPRRVEVMLRKEGEGIVAYLKGGKEVEETRKKEIEEAAAKARKKKEETSKKGKETAAGKEKKEETLTEEETEEKRKGQEKKVREQAVEKAAIKRKTSKKG